MTSAAMTGADPYAGQRRVFATVSSVSRETQPGLWPSIPSL